MGLRPQPEDDAGSGETLAAVYAVFEKAGGNLNVENSEGDSLHADGRAAMEEFNEAQHNQERTRGVLHDSWESLDDAFVEFKEACRGLEDAGKTITETKRKADDAHDRIRAHRVRCRRVSAEFETAEEDLNECLARMGQLIRDTAGATNTCVVMRHH